MRRGRPQKPSISVASIEAVLKTLGHLASEIPEKIALQQLALVDVFLENPARPASEDLRGWAIRSLITKIVSDALSEHRHYFDLAPASIREKRPAAIERIHEDSQTNSSVLLGWSILFYRYVRADLAITVQEFAEFASIHERTIRRERQAAILHLRDKLIEAEWEARRLNQRRLLHASIPVIVPKLLERDVEMNLILDAIEKNQNIHFFVTGGAGIGKSAFAASVANRLVENDALDFIVWLPKPEHFLEVKNMVEDRLLPYPSQTEISAMLIAYRTLVVIDDAEALIMQSEEWLDLLRYLSHAMVIICNREHILFPHPITHIPMAELSQFGICELIASYNYAGTINKTLQTQIWQTVGGNPRAVDYAVRQIVMGDSIQFGDAALHSMYDELFERFDDEQRWLWICLAVSLEGVDKETAAFLSSNNHHLFDNGLIEFTYAQQSLNLIASARHYIELLAKNLSGFVNKQLDLLLERISEPTQTFSNLFLAILDCSWLEIDSTTVQNVLCVCDTHYLTKPSLWRWWRLVHMMDEQEAFNIFLLKGVAARRLHYYQESAAIFERLVQETGKAGKFKQQAVARYELAVLYQTHAEFDRAALIYQQLESYLQINSDNLLFEQIKQQQARIAIETLNAEKALNYLLPYQKDIQGAVLLCEAYLIQNNWAMCRENAEYFLQEAQKQPILTASLYTIIGRSFAQEAKPRKALDYFDAALSLTERFSTDFDIARARCNVASAYLQLHEDNALNYAEELLQQAHSTQLLIQDTAGLLITERNLQELQFIRLNQ